MEDALNKLSAASGSCKDNKFFCIQQLLHRLSAEQHYEFQIKNYGAVSKERILPQRNTIPIAIGSTKEHEEFEDQIIIL
jgi:hypothetical protein